MSSPPPGVKQKRPVNPPPPPPTTVTTTIASSHISTGNYQQKQQQQQQQPVPMKTFETFQQPNPTIPIPPAIGTIKPTTGNSNGGTGTGWNPTHHVIESSSSPTATSTTLIPPKPSPPVRSTSLKSVPTSLSSISNKSNSSNNTSDSNGNLNNIGIDMIAKWGYTADQPDELTFLAGDYIRIISNPQNSKLVPEPGWCAAMHIKTSKIGLCPSHYLDRISTASTMFPPLQQVKVVSQEETNKKNTTSNIVVDAFKVNIHEDIKTENNNIKQSKVRLANAPIDYGDKFQFKKGSERFGKEGGYATDIIMIRSQDKLSATPFHVRFYGGSAKEFHEGDFVSVYIDNIKRIEMLMGRGGVASFRGGNLQCENLEELLPEILADFTPLTNEQVDTNTSAISDKDLSKSTSFRNNIIPSSSSSSTSSSKKLTSSVHRVRYEHICYESEDRYRYAECALFVWNVHDSCVVSDIDGTITKSDVRGMMNTTFLIKAGFTHNGYAHEGVCVLYQHIVQQMGAHMIYLTARPMDLIDATRTYVHTLSQNGRSLPPGPIITDKTNFMGSIRREVIEKTSHEFKTEMLRQLRGCYIACGRDAVKFPPILGGFGNKETDAIAYEAAGVPKACTFIVGTNSIMRAIAGYGGEIQSYDDPDLFKYLDTMMLLVKDGKLPTPPIKGLQ